MKPREYSHILIILIATIIIIVITNIYIYEYM